MPTAALDSSKLRNIVLKCLGASSEQLDDTFLDYVAGVLCDDPQLASDITELTDTISPFLLDASVVATEEEAAEICKKIVANMEAEGMVQSSKKNPHVQILSAPVNLSKMGISEKLSSVTDWMKPEERLSIVNKDAMARNEERYQSRKELRNAKEERKKARQSAAIQALAALKEKQNAILAFNKTNVANVPGRDIKVENFSLAYGKVELITCSDITIVYGRKYGLIGRNGMGKTTLLKHISNREIDIPSHMSVLHVEQEIEGTDTTVIQAVLQADVEREKLLAEEKRILSLGDDKTNTARLQKIYERLDAIDAHSAEARASAILAGLGFTQEMQISPTKEFSGGWRMRVALARALFIQPDLLLLDEPTNHLDLFACLWLENYLNSWDKTLIIVSHQRDFLNAVTTDVIHLQSKKLDFYRGNYDAFEKVRNERLKNQQRAHDAQTLQRKHMQAFVDKFRYNAKRAKMAQSRIKKLERMDIIPEVISDPAVIMQFLEPEPLTPPLLQFQDAAFGYSPDKVLFRNLNLGIDMDSRVALVGANGVGKTTLLRLLCGELEPTSGTALRHGKLKFARFSQHFVDQLDLTMSPLEFFMSKYQGINQQVARAHLGKFGLSGDLALRTINTLSGGQKSRVVFAVISWTRPQILLLDEPSNHLDIDTVDALTQALNEFPGGVLLVSHDERLISHVCDEIWVFDENEDGEKEIKVYDGDFDDYKRQVWNLGQ
jgi:ATP-binding cassette subfamily F protein 3